MGDSRREQVKTEAIERMARAIYEYGMMAECDAWKDLSDYKRQDFYGMAEDAFKAEHQPE